MVQRFGLIGDAVGKPSRFALRERKKEELCAAKR
jgi:hypothetical protein